MSKIKPYPVMVHGLDDARAAARAALALGVAVTLISAPAAGGYAGAGWFRALAAQVRAEFPGVDLAAVLDCGDQPGAVMAALRAGVTEIVFTGDPAVAAKLQAMAKASGAIVRTDRPPALDPRAARDKQAVCRDWLSGD